MVQHFESALTEELLANLQNEHHDNYDFYRFGGGPPEKPRLHEALKRPLREAARALGIRRARPGRTLSEHSSRLDELKPYIDGLSRLYDTLEDESSKLLLLRLVAYYVLGPIRVKLPLNTPLFWEQLKSAETTIDYSRPCPSSMNGWNLHFADLNRLGIPVQLYFTAPGVHMEFLLPQYEYRAVNKTIKPLPDDYVIDAGGFCGDTALFFADKIGADGRVFCFEPIPGNLAVMRENFALNPELERRITLVEHPVWESSDVPMYFQDRGPSSRVSMVREGDLDGECRSLSIDDLVERLGIAKVSMIKLDIEGAEQPAIRGATKTIRRFKPKLAIAIYHSWDDFVQIPEMIHSLGVGYKLYLGHSTIHMEETVLFAEAAG